MFVVWLLASFLSTSAQAAFSLQTPQGIVFVEHYQEQDQWVVDEFLVRPGKLQERRAHRVFEHKFQALDHLERLKRTNKINKAAVKVTVREAKAVPVWTVKNAWTAEWENRYAQWVADNFDAEFFVRHELATDCADAAYTLRWIFARINALPAAGTLAATGAVVTQDDGAAAWASIPTHADWSQDKRFRAALKWLLNNVYTKTLWKDGYPLRISRDTIRPGAIHLLGGHTLVLNKLVDNGRDVPVTFLSSTVPQAVRVLSLSMFLDSEEIPEANGGLIQFRWPVKTATGWSLTRKEAMADYSREQYTWREWCDEKSFATCVYRKLDLSFQPLKAVEGMILGLTDSLQLRQTIVRDGLAACATLDCSPGTVGYEDWSTPSRDKRLLESYQTSHNLAYSLGRLDENAMVLWTNWVDNVQAPLPKSPGQWFSLLEQSLVSYDPRDTLESRWASTPEGIEATVDRRWNTFTKLRQTRVAEAQSCRDNPSSCGVGSAEHKRLATHELDHEMRKTATHYTVFCTLNACPKELVNKMEAVWFMSSQPWLPLSERTGDTVARKASKVFYAAQRLFETRSGKVVVDTAKLYDPRTGVTLHDPGKVRYLVTQAAELLRLDEQGIALETQDGYRFLDTRSQSESGYEMEEIGPDMLRISEYVDDKWHQRVIKISTGGRLWQGEGSITFAYGIPYLFVSLNEAYRLVDLTNGQEMPLANVPASVWEIRVMAKLADGHFIFQALTYDENYFTNTYELLNGDVTVSSMAGYSQKMLLGNRHWLFEGNKVSTWELSAATPSLYGWITNWSALTPKQIGVTTSQGAKIISEAEGELYEFSNVSYLTSKIIGHKKDELSYADAEGFHVVDQQGRDLRAVQRWEGTGHCQSGATNIYCASNLPVHFSVLDTEKPFWVEGKVAGIPFSTMNDAAYQEAGIAINGTIVRPYENVLVYRSPAK